MDSMKSAYAAFPSLVRRSIGGRAAKRSSKASGSRTAQWMAVPNTCASVGTSGSRSGRRRACQWWGGLRASSLSPLALTLPRSALYSANGSPSTTCGGSKSAGSAGVRSAAGAPSRPMSARLTPSGSPGSTDHFKFHLRCGLCRRCPESSPEAVMFGLQPLGFLPHLRADCLQPFDTLAVIAAENVLGSDFAVAIAAAARLANLGRTIGAVGVRVAGATVDLNGTALQAVRAADNDGLRVRNRIGNRAANGSVTDDHLHSLKSPAPRAALKRGIAERWFLPALAGLVPGMGRKRDCPKL